MIEQKLNEVLKFWFKELGPTKWFEKNESIDLEIKKRFLPILDVAKKVELYSWRHTPEGRLAEIIVLDQFSRNIYRNDKRSFEVDNLALSLAQEAIYQKADQELSPDKKAFLYMPFMHSESLAIQGLSLNLYKQKGLENNFEFAKRHFEIIERFGRFPHRNSILGRLSTKEELDFLKTPNSSF